jgi:hypothetical protein
MVSSQDADTTKWTLDLVKLFDLRAPSLYEVEVRGKRTEFEADLKANVAFEAPMSVKSVAVLNRSAAIISTYNNSAF